MAKGVYLKAGYVLTVVANNGVVIAASDDVGVHQVVGTSRTFGPYMIETDWNVDGDATISTAYSQDLVGSNGSRNWLSNDGVFGVGPEGRQTILVMGNSMAAQNTFSIQSTGTNGSTFTADTAAGNTVVPVASGAGFATNDKVAVKLYSGETFLTTVASVAGNNVTLNAAIPKMVRSGDILQRYTTVAPTGINMNVGAINGVLHLMGSPLEQLRGYGYSGGRFVDMVADFILQIRRYRPSYVVFWLYENDIPNGITSAQLQRMTNFVIRAARGVGAKVIVMTPAPRTNYTAGAQVAVFDEMKAFVLGLHDPSNFIWAINVSDPWLDPTGLPTLRRPLTSVCADGTHPDLAKRLYVATLIYDQFAGIFPNAPSRIDWLNAMLSDNGDMAGTAGTTGGSGTVTGTFATGWVGNAPVNVTLNGSKTAEGYQRLQMTIGAATSDVTTQQTTLRKQMALPTAMRGGQMVKMVCAYTIAENTNISMIYPQMFFSGGETRNVGAMGDGTAGMHGDSSAIGRRLVVESAPTEIPAGATTIDIWFQMRPKTLGSPANVSADVTIDLFGIIPANDPIRGGIVLP